MINICIIVVIYNKKINNIASWEVFYDYFKKEKLKLVIIDNSVEKNIYTQNIAFLNHLKYKPIYISNKQNNGISKAYNLGINQVESDWYLFADDDTTFSATYLDNVLIEIKGSYNVSLCGVIKANNMPFSPCGNKPFMFYPKKYLIKPGKYKNIYAVNSGLVVSRKTLYKVGLFDERLFLDMVDYNFMESLKRLGCNNFKVLDGEITQNFSANEFQSLNNTLKRYKIFKTDMHTFCVINNYPKILGALLISKRFIGILLRSFLNYI